jgi:hypothetical protein
MLRNVLKEISIFSFFGVTTSYVSTYRAINQKSGDVTCELEEEFVDVT